MRGGAFVWIALRLVMIFARFHGAAAAAAAGPSTITLLVMLGIVAGLALLDVRIMGERVLWRNLGMTPLWMPALALAGAGVAEGLVQLALAALRVV